MSLEGQRRLTSGVVVWAEICGVNWVDWGVSWEMSSLEGNQTLKN
jgi:hypothetical protein